MKNIKGTSAMTKGIIFDMDGVIIDSEPLWIEAETTVFASVGINLTEELCSQTKGLRIIDMVNHWYIGYPWVNKPVQNIADEIIVELSNLIKMKATEMNGVTPLLKQLKSLGFKIGLASSSPKPIIEQVLNTLEIHDYFSQICSAEDDDFGKPHPAVYIRCATMLGIPPKSTFAIEDSVTGVISACAASMRCIAVPAKQEFDDPRFSIAYKKVPNLNDIYQLLI